MSTKNKTPQSKKTDEELLDEICDEILAEIHEEEAFVKSLGRPDSNNN